jgi:hypothetical protein
MTKPPTTKRTPAGKGASADALPRSLAFNGIDAATGEYLLPPMDIGALARVATGSHLEGDEIADLKNKSRRARRANYAVVEGVDPNDLAQAGWAVIFPAAADPDAAARQAAIRDALAPLLLHRRGQATAGGADLYREYIGELGYRADETKQQYLARLGAGPGPARPTKVPYYLLLVAAPEEIPYRIQYQLDVHYAVGRIAFDTVEEYARYAQSVVDAETSRAARPRRAAFFGAANPNDASTQLSADHLVLPLVEHVEGRYADRGWTVERYLAEEATRARLGELFREPPALLFAATHGVGFRSGDPHQRECQGALLCQDWPGPGNRTTREHYFAAADLPAGADLRGMIGVFFACYGGGTPRRDEFTQRALGEAKAKELAPAPILARLPQRMLGHPAGGALAVVAHVDRAWGSSFLWIDAQGKRQTMAHLDVFESMLDSVLAGKRLGYAMEAFNLRYAELAADLSERIEQIQIYGEQYEESELAHMWIHNSDARNHAVIGDPAVYLPAAAELARAAARRAPTAPREGAIGAVTTAPGEHAPGPASRGGVPQAGVEAPSYGWFSGKDDGGDEGDRGEQRPGFMERLGNKIGSVLGAVLNDAAVLEIKTYSGGDLQAVAAGESLRASGARLLAYTRCELDGDIEVCVPTTTEGAVDAAVWTMHADMVKQAQAHRTELLKILLSLFSPNVRK